MLFTDFDNIENPSDSDLDDLVEDWFITKLNSDVTVIQFKELYSNETPDVLHLTKISN